MNETSRWGWCRQGLLGLLVAAAAFRDDLLRLWTTDDSWLVGLYEARHLGLRWGRDIVFTYGPLGFLEHPRFEYPGPSYVALAVQLAVLASIAVALARAWSRCLHPVAAWLVAYVIVAVIGWSADIAVIAGVVPVLGFAANADRRPNRLGLLAAVSAVVGLLALVKISLAPMSVAIAIALGLLTLDRGRRRLILLMPVVSLLSATLAWLVLGQRLGDLLPFAATGAELASGYSQAMAVERPGRAWEYGAAGLLALLVLGVAVHHFRGAARRDRIVAIAFVITSLAFSFRLGFVRHDVHSRTFFAGVVLLLSAMVPDRRVAGRSAAGPAVRLAAVLVAVAVLWVAADLQRGVLLDGPSRAAGLASRVQGANDPDELYRAKLGGLMALEVPTALLDRVERDPVHIDPQEIAIVTMAGLKWRPAPVFQAYSAYTSRLDDLNAAMVRDRGPRWILRRVDKSIDGRNPWWESPRYQLEVLCRYRIDQHVGEWQLLERSTEVGCGRLRPLAAERSRPGRAVVPDAGDDAVFVRISCPRSRLEKAMQVLFKPRHEIVVDADARRYRLVPAHLAVPLVVRSRDTQLETLHVAGCAKPATFEFFAMAT